MFTTKQKKQQYLTYILADETTKSYLEVVPERGGIITSWRFKDQEILYLDQQRFADPSLSIRGGIPILFPICGNLPHNIYNYQGQSYTLKQHGFARDLPWKVTETITNNSASITLVLESNKQTLAVYPFEFQLSFTYQLQGNSLKIHQSYTNNSKEIMPFSTGLHPYFCVGDKSQLSFDIPASQYQNQITKEIHPFGGEFDWNAEEIDAAFLNINRHSTSITAQEKGLEIKIIYSDLYSTLVFWTIKGKNYVCLEPWSAPRNSLNTGEKLTYLEPESTVNTLVEMSAMNF